MTNHFTTARTRKAVNAFNQPVEVTDLQDRLNAAYALIGDSGPALNRSAVIANRGNEIFDGDVGTVAAGLARGALATDSDLDDLLDGAVAELARLVAWDAIKLRLHSAARDVEAAAYADARDTAYADLAPFVKKTLAEFKKVAVKLADVADPFNADQIIAAEASGADVAALARGLRVLGTVARLQPVWSDGVRGLVRFVDVANPGDDYTGDVPAALRTLHEVIRRDQHDLVLVDIARGRYAGVTLSFTADAAEVALREARLDAAAALPAPKVAMRVLDASERNKYKVGPDTSSRADILMAANRADLI